MLRTSLAGMITTSAIGYFQKIISELVICRLLRIRWQILGQIVSQEVRKIKRNTNDVKSWHLDILVKFRCIGIYGIWVQANYSIAGREGLSEDIYVVEKKVINATET